MPKKRLSLHVSDPFSRVKKTHLSINTTQAAVKAPDELQRELMMLEYMSKLKQESDDKRPNGGKQKTCAKDNKCENMI